MSQINATDDPAQEDHSRPDPHRNRGRPQRALCCRASEGADARGMGRQEYGSNHLDLKALPVSDRQERQRIGAMKLSTSTTSSSGSSGRPDANWAQWALLECPIFEVFFGGARGGGKTDGALGEFMVHADALGQHASGLMVRRTYKELVDTIERSRAIYGPLKWTYNETEKLWRDPRGARLRFAYLDRDSDAEGYQGHSYTRVYIEEIGNFPSPAPVFKLFATLRSGAGVPVGFRATGNPGGPGPPVGEGALHRSGAARQSGDPRSRHRAGSDLHPEQGGQ